MWLMVEHGTIALSDVDRILVTDDVAAAVAHIRAGASKHLGEQVEAPCKPSVLLGESVPKAGTTATPPS